jgi:hypothetical protein
MIAIGIMTHPERAAHAESLRVRLSRQCLSAAFAGVDALHPFVIEDTWRRGCWLTARETWIAGAATGADHVLVIQDDAIPCADFVRTLGEVLSARPSDPVSCFTPWPVMRRARALDRRWIELRHFAFTQALAMPRWMVLDAIAWIDANTDPRVCGVYDDTRLGLYFLAHERSVFATAPSLVQHDDRIQSLIGNPGGRVSEWAVGERDLGMRFDWTRLEAIDASGAKRPTA